MLVSTPLKSPKLKKKNQHPKKKYASELTLKSRATLALFKKEDLVDALRDYPEDRALLARKAQKAAKEVAAKQAANAPVVSKMSKDVIVKVNKDPVLVTTVLKLVPEKSNIFNWLTMGTSVEETQSEDILVVEKEEKTK